MTTLEKLSRFLQNSPQQIRRLTSFGLLVEAKAEIERLEKENRHLGLVRNTVAVQKETIAFLRAQVAARYSDSEIEGACSDEMGRQVRKLLTMRRQSIDKEKIGR